MTPNARKLFIKTFEADLQRARDLYTLLVVNGGKLNSNQVFTRFRQPEKLDISQARKLDL
jgi:hypothetical protein